MASESKRILVVEDDSYFRRSLQKVLEAEDFEVSAVGTADDAIAQLQENSFDAAILDWHLGPDHTGTDVLREIARTASNMPVIMISAYVNVPEIASAYKLGIVDYLRKPVQPAELVALLRKFLFGASAQPPADDDEMQLEKELIGNSLAMQEVRKLLSKFAPTDAMILLEGETGTGKEVAARALHRLRNSNKPVPFEAVNCGGFSSELVESELFGHVKGAFTGAHSTHRGVFDRATGGTVFLDEIGELPLTLQPKLLRVLDTREYRPVGGEVTKKFIGKVIFATNRNLRTESAEGRFRLDLYSRISEVVVTMPPLRYRAEDIESLIRHFLASKDLGARKQFSGMAMSILRNYSFSSGNVRQLRRYVLRAFYNSSGDVIQPNDLPLDEMAEVQANELTSGAWITGMEALLKMPFKDAKNRLVQDFEHRYIEYHYRTSGYHIGRTAKAVELSERQLSQKLLDYGLHKPGSEGKTRNESA
ncbi:MAG TPA: sigma-54 dependent transcriptional regulator [Thermoanaerobaculia bacterium]|jgi:DNA-binding NtrC family response regulator